MERTAPERESNIELLRVVSMLMIIIFHCAYKSGFSFEPGFSVNKLIVKMFWMLGELGTNLFLLISGYFAVSSHFKWKKLVRLLVEVQFYTWSTAWLGSRLFGYRLADWSWKTLLFNFFPVTLNRYWFITAYILIYILSPFLNILIRGMDKKIFRRFLAVVLGLYCVIPTVFGVFFNTTEDMLYYNRMIWLVVVYFLGAYLQKQEKEQMISKKFAIRATLVSVGIMVGSILVIDRFSEFFAALGTVEPAYFWRPNTIPMVTLSIGVFCLFRHIKFPYYPAINAVASTTLGIYLMHDGNLQDWLWRTVFRCAEYQDSPLLFLRILMSAVVIFIIGAAIDLLRQTLERYTLNRLLDSKHIGFSYYSKGGNMITHSKGNRGKAICGGRYFRIFCSAFLAYVFLGICLSYTAFDSNMFFGADNARALSDLVDIGYSHYRTKVHPLFPLLTETITLMIDGAVNRTEMSVIIFEALCGALSVCLFDAILKQKKVGQQLRNIFTCIYGFSFSTIVFSTVPETFIFAALGLVAFLYFLSVASQSEGAFSKRELFLLIFFGTVCCGITLTNYVFYLLGVIYLLLCRYDLRGSGKMFLKLNGLNAIAVIAACLYQKLVWNQCPLFWTSILDGVTGRANYEETLYMDWTFSLEKTGIWIKRAVFNPLLSPDIYMENPAAEYHPILFAGYPIVLKILLLAFYIVLAIYLIVWLAKKTKKFDLTEDGYVCCLLIAYAGNLGLHYIYGFYEAFMYSPHYLLYILLTGAIVLDRVQNWTVEKIVIPGLWIFCGAEAANNLKLFFKTVQIALDSNDTSLNVFHAVKGTILCGAVLLVIIRFGTNLRIQGEQSPTSLDRNAENGVQRLYKIIKVYIALVVVSSMFIAYNY